MFRAIPRSFQRLAIMLLSLPFIVLLLALLYQAGMAFLEGQPRGLGRSIGWVTETLTSVGYGSDSSWTHPVMQVYVAVVQFAGLFLAILVFPVFLLPFFEERFESRLPSRLPELVNHVLVYRYGSAVTSLLEELDRVKVPVVVFEENPETARWLRERGRQVVLGNIEQEDPDLSSLVAAKGLVLNGADENNAVMALSARYHGYRGPIIAVVADPGRRAPMVRAGATTVVTPDQVLAAALASRASIRVNPRVSGSRPLGHFLEVAELRIHAASPLAGKTIRESAIRSRTGATVVGIWVGGELGAVDLARPLAVGSILVAVGGAEGIRRLGDLATPVSRTGRIIVAGHGPIGQRVAHLLKAAGEDVHVIHPEAGPGVDTAGDPLTPGILERAGVMEAQAVLVALETDAAAVFGTAVVRNLAPEVLIVTAAQRAENISRIHRVGADFALSVGQVAGQLMAFHLLRQAWVSLEAGIKLISTSAGDLAERPFPTRWIREQTGCVVVAVERGNRVFMEFDSGFAIERDDVVYLSGTPESIGAYFLLFPGTQELPAFFRTTEEQAAVG
ncbi:MAG TPA: NAD-binding protein [Gemmatimonadales bacterium]|nr:NAD-binding protein [Gemmatimonadales bacterium]